MNNKDITDWINSGEELVIEPASVPERKPYEIITLSESPPTPTKWIIDEILPEESCLVMGAEEKTGKTWLLLYLAICISSGKKVFDAWQPRKKGNIVIYTPESGWNAKKQRLWGLCWGMGLDPVRALKSLHFIKGSIDLGNQKLLEHFVNDVKKISPVLTVFDPLICLHSGLDENSSGEMQGLLNSIRGISQCVDGMSVIVTHHLNKGNSSKSSFHGLRGSSAIGAWADGRISLSRDRENSSIRKVDIEHRDAPSPRPVGFSITCMKNYESELYEFKLNPCEINNNPNLDQKILGRIEKMIEKNNGMTRYEGASAMNMARSKFNRYFNALLDRKKVRLDAFDKMFLVRENEKMEI